MRKLAIAAICAALALALTGCGGNVDKSGNVDDRFSSTRGDVAVATITDRRTGVEYLAFTFGNSGGLSPLLNADGTPYTEDE